MKTTDLITDTAIAIVFENTKFGGRDHREVIQTNLQAVSDGYHIGYTAQCCLLELGLIFSDRPRHRELTKLGSIYLELAKKEVKG